MASTQRPINIWKGTFEKIHEVKAKWSVPASSLIDAALEMALEDEERLAKLAHERTVPKARRGKATGNQRRYYFPNEKNFVQKSKQVIHNPDGSVEWYGQHIPADKEEKE